MRYDSADMYANFYQLTQLINFVISLIMVIIFADSVAKIAGGRSVYMREGSLLNISCTIQGQVIIVVPIIVIINNMISIVIMQVKAAQEILWYRDKHLLNSSGRGGISITTDKVTIMTMMMLMMVMIMLMIIFENWL